MPALPRVSIVVPTLQGEVELARLLPALADQELDGGFEIVAIDSSSTDGTVALLREHGARTSVIPRAEFGHGKTRNLAAKSARGELLVFLSQDVVPANERFLAKLVAPFDGDARVAGVTSRVLPHPDDDPLTARTVLDLPEASDRAGSRDLDGIGAFWELPPEERARRVRFNNVASAIRASVFRKIPFPEVPFAEDFAWAARALTAGWRIAHAPESIAYHAHDYGFADAFERYKTDAAFHRAAHGWQLRPSLYSVARGVLFEVRRDLAFLFRRGRRVPGRLRHALRSPGLRAAQVLGQYAGSRG